MRVDRWVCAALAFAQGKLHPLSAGRAHYIVTGPVGLGKMDVR